MEEKEKQLEEKTEGQKKNNLLGVILVSFLLIGLSLACGWFANSYFTKDSNVKTNNSSSNIDNHSSDDTQEEWKDLGIDISKVKDTYDTVKDYMYVKNLPNGGLSLDKEETMNIVAQRHQQTDLINVKEDNTYTGQGFLSYDKANFILKKYLGNNYKLDTTAIGSYVCTSIGSYNSDTKLFKVSWGPCDGHGPTGEGESFKYYFTPLRKITSVQEKADEIKVIEKVIYVSFSSSYSSNVDGKYSYNEFYNVYSDLQKTNYIGQLEVKSNKNYVDDFLDKAGTLTSLYRKAEDGTYYFVSSEING